MFRKSYHDESYRPPPESGDGDGKLGSWDWGEALITTAAYMIDDDRNHTTARCTFIDNDKDKEEEEVELQVTFRLAPPPHISYFCVGYTSGEPTEFLTEPNIVAMEGNLALINLLHGTSDLSKFNYLVYTAPTIHGHGDDDEQPPLLHRIPRPSRELFLPSEDRFFHADETGILRYSTTRKRSEQALFTPPTPTLTIAPATPLAVRRHKSNFTSSDDCDAYKIASLYRRYKSHVGGTFDLYTYDSKVNAWTCEATAFSQSPAPPEPETHFSNKVITIGGTTMGWVNLSRGIILCNLMHVAPPGDKDLIRPLRYIPLPVARQPDNHIPLYGTPSFFRDVAVVQGRIKLVHLQTHASLGSSLVPNGWTAVTWSMALDDSGFGCPESELHSCDIVNGGLEPSLFVGHPTLSSEEDGVLYLMAQFDVRSHDSRVIAVNMKTKKLEGVAKFTTQRTAGMNYGAFKHTTISKYLTPPDPKRTVKQRGQAMRGSSRKKPRLAITFMSKQPSGYGGDQVDEKNLHPMGDDGDSMDLA